MTDAQTDALDSMNEEEAVKGLKNFTFERALDIRKYLINVGARNRTRAKEVLFKQIDYYLENKELGDLLFTLSGGHACGNKLLHERGFRDYLIHVEYCRRCSMYLSEHNLTPEKISKKLDKIKKDSPDCVLKW